MKRLMFAALLAGLLCLRVASVYASAGLKPTPPPTPGPADQTQEEKPTAAPTATPTKSPVNPTVPPTPTDAPSKPTAPPTPGSASTPTESAASTRSKPTALPTPTSGADAGPASTGQSRAVTGRVFNDQDGDGQPDPDEPGVGGVSVVADGQVVASTDEDGRFQFTPVGGGKKVELSVVAPEEWDAPGEAVKVPVPADVAIPLHLRKQRVLIEPQTAATLTGGLVGIAILAALAFNAVAALTQAASVRALRTTYRRHKSRELELAMEQGLERHRRDLLEELNDNPDAWQGVIRQLLADAQVSVETLTTVEVLDSPPRILVNDGAYEFTTDPEHAQDSPWFRQSQVIALDAALSPTARVEAQALWDHLAGEKGLHGSTLPRDADWYLVVHEMRWSLSGRGGQWKRLAVYGAAALLALVVVGAGVHLALNSRRPARVMPWVVSTPTPTNTATPTTTPTIAPTATSAITPTVAPTATPMVAVVTGTQGIKSCGHSTGRRAVQCRHHRVLPCVYGHSRPAR